MRDTTLRGNCGEREGAEPTRDLVVFLAMLKITADRFYWTRRKSRNQRSLGPWCDPDRAAARRRNWALPRTGHGVARKLNRGLAPGALRCKRRSPQRSCFPWATWLPCRVLIGGAGGWFAVGRTRMARHGTCAGSSREPSCSSVMFFCKRGKALKLESGCSLLGLRHAAGAERRVFGMHG